MSVASRPSPMMFDTKLPQPNDSFRWVQVGGRARRSSAGPSSRSRAI